MNRKIIIENINNKINLLPDNKVQEIDDFAEFLLSKIDDKIITEGIRTLANDSKTFDFLQEEKDLYTVKDLKEKYK